MNEVNEYRILNGKKYRSLGILQNYLIFLSTKNYFRFLTNVLKVYIKMEETIKKFVILKS